MHESWNDRAEPWCAARSTAGQLSNLLMPGDAVSAIEDDGVRMVFPGTVVLAFIV